MTIRKKVLALTNELSLLSYGISLNDYLRSNLRISGTRITSNGNNIPYDIYNMIRNTIRQSNIITASRSLYIPERTLELWDVDYDNILESTYKYDTQPKMEKFSYHTPSGEFLMSYPGQHHATEIHNKGSYPYDDYVRGIVAHTQHMVALRPTRPGELFEKLLKKNRGSREDAENEMYFVSYDRQEATKEMLIEHGARDWDFQFNVNNPVLEELTGRPRSEW